MDSAAPGSNRRLCVVKAENADIAKLFNCTLLLQWTAKKTKQVDQSHLVLASDKLVLQKVLYTVWEMLSYNKDFPYLLGPSAPGFHSWHSNVIYS